MAIRFRRTIKLFPSIKLNIGKNGISTSVGIRGAHLTFSKSGTYLGTGIPGTGLSQRTKLSGPAHAEPVEAPSIHGAEVPTQGKHYKLGVVFWLIFGTIILAIFQIPQLLAFYWLLIAAYVIIRFVVRAVRKKPEVAELNLVEKLETK